jgi:hypothetical protein
MVRDRPRAPAAEGAALSDANPSGDDDDERDGRGEGEGEGDGVNFTARAGPDAPNPPDDVSGML